ncbi:hypothetical protein EDB81DRAFT_872328 [Dactylonectria macrodidyma]|uniref:NAD(P)-binding domain-containing protein n=1 Tax=Dactylonectria macrodidyma TaxID=307937 RepID=A0A9P9DSJ3_9HYPO|nr:hypothetical protein EDB81DRAFT_872328 [Dactylonectria macrodidyma]
MGYLRSDINNVALVRHERYNWIALVRDKLSILPLLPHVRVVEVDYESHESLVSALQGQDVLVSALGKAGLYCQARLVDAAFAVNVRRIIQSEFGANLVNPKMRMFPTNAPKGSLENQLTRSCELSNLSYMFIYTNCLLDWAIASYGALLVDPNHKFSTISMATVGHAVVAVLDRFDETANRAICVQDIAISRMQLLELVKEVTAGDGGQEWAVVHINTEEAEAQAQAALDKGAMIIDVLYGFAVRAAFAPGYGGHFSPCDNELLGIKGMR